MIKLNETIRGEIKNALLLGSTFDQYVYVRIEELEKENERLNNQVETWKEKAFKAQAQTEDVLAGRLIRR